MAIDTKEKRASIIGVGRPWIRDKFPVSGKDAEWRASSGNTYGGNAFSAAVPTGPFFNSEYDLRLDVIIP